jgi:nucleotide-binding universal stress UspA family protein
VRFMAAIDVGEPADAFVQAAARWAATCGATLDLVYAAGTSVSEEIYAAHLQRLFGERTEPAAGRDALDALLTAHVPVAERGEARVVVGRPLTTLPAIAAGYDAVLVATHGRAGVVRVAIGSVADRLARTAQCPVGILPLHGRMEPGASARVLVTTDLSAASAQGVKPLLALLRPTEVHAVHVATGILGGERVAPPTLLTELTERVSSFLDGHDVKVDEVHVRATADRNPGAAVVALAESLGVSAIVTAARGADDVPTLGLGSVTGRLLHLSSVPVWVAHV